MCIWRRKRSHVCLALWVGIISLFSVARSEELPFEPTVVAVPPANAFRSLWRYEDGSIHSHGFTGTFRNPEGLVTLVSRDEGLHWNEEPLMIIRPRDKKDPFYTYIPPGLKRDPHNGDWVAVIDGEEPYLARWAGSPWEVAPSVSVITQRELIMMRPPIFIRGGSRLIAAGHHLSPNPIGGRTSIFYSDDRGEVWGAAHLPDAPRHSIMPPHEGLRWQNPGVEPTIVKLNGGRLWCLLRTSQDRHYETYSEDGGESWSALAPSPFWGTLTMKTFHRLPDGRLMLVWTNATPLPERAHAERVQGAKDWETGREDVFTNRETLHAAISQDEGRTWRGFREILINELRNAPDFGTSHGGVGPSNDRSVHQSQVIDLKEGRVLIQAGQHPALRRLLILHPDWLLETTRSDDFSKGLDHWHVQLFKHGVVGHCAYNRVAGAKLVKDPAGNDRNVLWLRNSPDPTLLGSVQGALWNFPLGRRGTFKTSVYFPSGSKGGLVALNDRWLVPGDLELRRHSPVRLNINSHGRIEGTSLMLKPDQWHDLEITWSYDRMGFELQLDDQSERLPFATKPVLAHGFSYAHFQSSEIADERGIMLGPVSVEVD